MKRWYVMNKIKEEHGERDDKVFIKTNDNNDNANLTPQPCNKSK